MVLMLHGLGGDEDVMWIFGNTIPPQATVLSPRAPIRLTPGTPLAEYMSGGYSWLRPSPLPQPDRATFATAVDLLRRFMSAAIEVYNVDRANVYLLGFSQGAALSYALSLAEPDTIAGAIALAGFLPEGEGQPTPPDIPLHGTPRRGYLILHGLDDDQVKIRWARKARDTLRALGAPVEYHEYSLDHKVSSQGMRTMQEWLKRNTNL